MSPSKSIDLIMMMLMRNQNAVELLALQLLKKSDEEKTK